MRQFILLLLANSVVGANDSIDSYGPHCFSETTIYGTPRAGSQEIPASDKTELDNIAQSDYGVNSRVTALRYCVTASTGYLNSIQAGLSNGFGSKIKWQKLIGLDDATRNALVSCKTYEMERDDYRVAEMEIGSQSTGVIWLSFIMRDVKYKSPSPTDVKITIGKPEPVPLMNINKI